MFSTVRDSAPLATVGLEAGAEPDQGAPVVLDGASGKATWILSGPIAIKTDCPAGQGKRVHVALSEACGDWGALVELQTKTAYALTGYGLYVPGYSFNIPDGIYYLNAFLDCDDSADPSAPAPATGDVRFTLKTGSGAVVKPCRSYELHGQGVLDAPVLLNELVE